MQNTSKVHNSGQGDTGQNGFDLILIDINPYWEYQYSFNIIFFGPCPLLFIACFHVHVCILIDSLIKVSFINII